MIPTPFDNAGKLLRAQVDAPATQAEHAILRAKLVEAATGNPRRGRSLLPLVLVPAVVMALAFLLWLRPWGGDRGAVTFQVGPSRAAGVVGDYVNPVDKTELQLTFSEGTTVVLEPQARARVTRTTSRGASVVLETGTARVDVSHRAGAEWTVAAGPYTIAVKGTSFDVSWEASSGTLHLAMRTGVVVVRGPGIEAGVEVRDTQRFVSRAVATIDSGDSAAAVSASAAALIPPGPEDQSLAPQNAAPAAASDAVPSESTAPAPSQSPPSEPWSRLAARGDFRTILQEAEQRGVDTTLSSASESDIAALGNAARHAGRSDLARRALMTIRSRFPAGGQAAPSAFLLGRMSEDAGDIAGAIRWYDVYLGEAPGGSLAPEASGRKMVALRKSGQAEAARAAAQGYLARFPSGPYSGIAQELLKP